MESCISFSRPLTQIIIIYQQLYIYKKTKQYLTFVIGTYVYRCIVEKELKYFENITV